MTPQPSARDSLAWRGERIRLDRATAEAFDGLESAGVHARLLKGRSISSWLYDETEIRPQTDCDLLIAPADLAAAEALLESLGYRRHWDDRAMPSWWREHAGEWLRDRDNSVFDVHRTLPGVEVDPDAAWRTLSSDVGMVTVAWRQVPALGLPARALHVALHAAQHGVGSTAVEDLRRALRIADLALWRGAAELARELDAVDAFAAGLRLHADGVALAQSLGLPSAVSTDAALRASVPPPVALGFEQLARARGARAKAAIVWHKLVPPAEFIRHWDASAGQSRAALLRAYLRRPFWLLGRAPRGLRAWREMRASRRSS